MDIVIIDGLSFALPLFIMAIGGIYCEKSGVTMLAVEGLQGFGAFIGAFVAVAIAGNFSGDSPVPFYIAMIMAAVGGSIFALIHALLCLKFKANQVISGVVVNILAMALTAYLTKLLNRVVFGATSDKFVLTVSSRITIPGISKIPVLGAVFTNLYPFELVIVAVAFIAWFVMYKTRFGLRLRACGEHPQAADSVGINVYKMRYAGVLISGFLCGVGGLAYTVAAGSGFNSDVGGYGFLALAVMIFGNWKPFPILASSLFFALFKVIAAYSSSLSFLPKFEGVKEVSNFYQMLPYIVTMIVLIFTSKNSQAPKAEGIPYDKGSR